MPVRRHRARLSFSRLRPTRWFFVFRQPLLTRDPPDPDPSDTNTKRETGRTAQLNNIAAAKVREQAHRTTRESDPSVKSRQTFPRARIRAIWAHRPPPPRALTRPSHPSSWRAQAVADIIRTTLGPRSMLKMILDASGGACRATPAQITPRATTSPRSWALGEATVSLGLHHRPAISTAPPTLTDPLSSTPQVSCSPTTVTRFSARSTSPTRPLRCVHTPPTLPFPSVNPSSRLLAHEDAPRPSDGSSTFAPPRRSELSPSPPIPEPTLNFPSPPAS